MNIYFRKNLRGPKEVKLIFFETKQMYNNYINVCIQCIYDGKLTGRLELEKTLFWNPMML